MRWYSASEDPIHVVDGVCVSVCDELNINLFALGRLTFARHAIVLNDHVHEVKCRCNFQCQQTHLSRLGFVQVVNLDPVIHVCHGILQQCEGVKWDKACSKLYGKGVRLLPQD